MLRWILNLELCLLPLEIAPVLGYLISEGVLNFGGGEKDILLLIPWLVWSLLYAVLFIIFWMKGWTTKRRLAVAVGGASGICLVAWLALYFWAKAWLGVSR
jgi:hypothetical protein